MRILMVHNDYGAYSGEEAVVDRMIADGRDSGIEIEVLRRTSKFSRDSLIGKWRAFFNGIYSPSGRRMMREALKRFKPDIVHIHNLYPFISPAALFLCRKAQVPVVMTVHNYRLICPTGLFLRDGKPCELCLEKGDEWSCIKYNCEQSMTRSVAYALRNYVARKTGAYLKCVNYFCCLTVFQKEKLMEAGYNADKLFVFPNYVAIIDKPKQHKPQQPGGQTQKATYIGYVGRYNHAKGTDLLVEIARRHPEIPFKLAGNMAEAEGVELPPNLEACGMLNKEQLAEFYEGANFIVIPSRCYEGFPLVLLEAFSHSKACVAPNHGAFPDLMHFRGINCGQLFTPIDVDDLEQKVVEMWNNPTLTTRLGHVAGESYNTRFVKKNINIAWDKFLRQVSANGKAHREANTTKRLS